MNIKYLYLSKLSANPVKGNFCLLHSALASNNLMILTKKKTLRIGDAEIIQFIILYTVVNKELNVSLVELQ